MAAWLRTLLSVVVITANAAVTTGSTGDPSSSVDLSITLSTITDFPQIKLYTSQSELSDKIKFDASSTANKDDASLYHEDVRDRGDLKKSNDTLKVTVIPSSNFLWNKKRGGNSSLTEDGNTGDEDYAVGMPVAAALKADSNGYTRSDGTYMVNDEDGVACVMAYFKCQATIYYADSKGDYQSKVISPAEDSEVDGSCDRVGQISEVSVLWSNFVLTLRFGKDDLTDSYFVSKFSLTYDLSDPMFPDSGSSSSSLVTVSSTQDRKFWQTNNYYSFRCLLLHDIALSDPLNNTATLHFDEVRVQAFCEDKYFRRPKHCIHRVHRDEMVPVTVGGALAGSTILTVIFYGIFRYFKIKKVQYDTMA